MASNKNTTEKDMSTTKRHARIEEEAYKANDKGHSATGALSKTVAPAHRTCKSGSEDARSKANLSLVKPSSHQKKGDDIPLSAIDKAVGRQTASKPTINAYKAEQGLGAPAKVTTTEVRGTKPARAAGTGIAPKRPVVPSKSAKPFASEEPATRDRSAARVRPPRSIIGSQTRKPQPKRIRERSSSDSQVEGPGRFKATARGNKPRVKRSKAAEEDEIEDAPVVSPSHQPGKNRLRSVAERRDKQQEAETTEKSLFVSPDTPRRVERQKSVQSGDSEVSDFLPENTQRQQDSPSDLGQRRRQTSSRRRELQERLKKRDETARKEMGKYSDELEEDEQDMSMTKETHGLGSKGDSLDTRSRMEIFHPADAVTAGLEKEAAESQVANEQDGECSPVADQTPDSEPQLALPDTPSEPRIDDLDDDPDAHQDAIAEAHSPMQVAPSNVPDLNENDQLQNLADQTPGSEPHLAPPGTSSAPRIDGHDNDPNPHQDDNAEAHLPVQVAPGNVPVLNDDSDQLQMQDSSIEFPAPSVVAREAQPEAGAIEARRVALLAKVADIDADIKDADSTIEAANSLILNATKIIANTATAKAKSNARRTALLKQITDLGSDNSS